MSDERKREDRIDAAEATRILADPCEERVPWKRDERGVRLYRNIRKSGDHEGKVHTSPDGRRTLCGRRMGLFFREVVDVKVTCGKCDERASRAGSAA